jgi:phage baseplate assembly protein W
MTTTDMLGKDIEIDDDYDIIFTSNNDFKTNNYQQNLLQAIKNRLQTPMGFFERYPLYGSNLHTVLGLPRIDSTLIYARSMVYNCLLQEPRIKRIVSISCQFVDINLQKDALRINIMVESIIDTSPITNLVYDYFLV